ncbi:hypothetical protein [Pseudomonas leptonychotis]|uniref:DUF4760 domain-containing protein n=1 Tax=Pseudomonas leptonychotis TaxID=2448482 RepID=A0A4T1ZQ20_9PSED|nr:hypothetical protein [Pseudomonas leptonychotis]TIH06230.1 hypothetical protein D8779_20365 [Pseudomonas leptonychotis]
MEVFFNILAALGGASVVLTGLFAYIGNSRLESYKAQLQAANEKAKSMLESSVHVSKSQFDKEFAIYHQIWACLIKLRARTLSLRPMLDHVDPNESEEERVNKRLMAFGETFYIFRDVMEENRPFYSISVYESLQKIFHLCHEESIEYQYKEDGWNIEYWNKAKVNHEIITSEIEACCELIRTRISSMSVAA